MGHQGGPGYSTLQLGIGYIVLCVAGGIQEIVGGREQCHEL